VGSHRYCHSSSERSLCCWSAENGQSPIHFYLDITLWCPATFYTDLQLVLITFRKIPSDIWLLGCAQWIPQSQRYDDLVPENTNTRTGIGKTMYLLSLRKRTTRRRYNSSFDNARTINCSLNKNTNYDPITKSGFTIQSLQKNGLFLKIHMFCDSVMLMKIPPKSQKVSIIKKTSTTSVHKKCQYHDRVR